MFTNTPLAIRFQKIDPQLSAVVIGAEVTRLGASKIGAKRRAHVGVDAEVAMTWQLVRRQLYWRQVWRQDRRRRDPVLNPWPLFLPEYFFFLLFLLSRVFSLPTSPYLTNRYIRPWKLGFDP
jgi:hypothetical protein